jgi:hypothetical protein
MIIVKTSDLQSQSMEKIWEEFLAKLKNSNKLKRENGTLNKSQEESITMKKIIGAKLNL